jgi:hypothetical protein
MTDSVTAPAAIGRLAHQLQTLSQVSETLTYRLIELEERVAALELLVQPLLTARSAEATQLSEDAAHRLDETEARLAELESMLSSFEGAAVMQPQPVDQPEQSLGAFQGGRADDDQLFLDEQAYTNAVETDDVQEFPADDFDDDQRLIA